MLSNSFGGDLVEFASFRYDQYCLEFKAKILPSEICQDTFEEICLAISRDICKETTREVCKNVSTPDSDDLGEICVNLFRSVEFFEPVQNKWSYIKNINST